MPIDARIPMMGIQFDAGAAMERGMRLRQMQEQLDNAREDRKRDTERRASLADLLLAYGQGGGDPSSGQAMGGQAPGGQSPGSLAGLVAPGAASGPQVFGGGPNPDGSMSYGGGGPEGFVPGNQAAPHNPRKAQVAEQMGQQGPSDRQRQAYERAVRADPEGFLTFEGNRLDITGKHLKAYRDLNDTAMQLLGGVYDQGSYERAKAEAHNLYARHGMDLNDQNLPDQYSPELVRSLQMQGMDTSKQLQAVARENKLNWDQYDDQEDNSRADTLAGSTVEDRDARREYTRQRVEIARERARQAGKGKGAKPPAAAKPPGSEGAVYADIANRWLDGQPISPRETRFAQEYESRHTPKGRGPGGGGRGGRGSSTADGAIIRNPTTGQRMMLQGGKWVPVK